jgi:hypothetical protein
MKETVMDFQVFFSMPTLLNVTNILNIITIMVMTDFAESDRASKNRKIFVGKMLCEK